MPSGKRMEDAGACWEELWAVKPVFLSGETNPLVQQGCKFPVLFWVTVSSKEVIKTEGAVMLWGFKWCTWLITIPSVVLLLFQIPCYHSVVFFFFFNLMDGGSVNFLKTCLLYGSAWQRRCCKTITEICPSLEWLIQFGGMTVVNANLVILGMWGAHACGGSACIHTWRGLRNTQNPFASCQAPPWAVDVYLDVLG